ncbi:MAG: RNA-binding cell elongation regulator Jag/EloR [Candidatus Eisenbacteria bacterium]
MERNPNEVFCEGRNVEEALQAACDKLDTTPNQVEYEVVEQGTGGGMLGFLKGRVTKIRVWKKSASERKLNELLKGFFEVLDLDLTFQINRAEDAYEIDIQTEGSDGLLIGRGGETLAALQHLISRMASHMDEELRVRVDVAGYRKRRQDQLRRKARELADRSLASGKEMLTEPLPADERRIVHLTLGDDPRVETRAIGDGLTKRVMVVPAGRSAGGERREGGADRGRGGRRGGTGSGSGRRGTGEREPAEAAVGRDDGRENRSAGRDEGRENRTVGRDEGRESRAAGRDEGREDRRPSRDDDRESRGGDGRGGRRGGRRMPRRPREERPEPVAAESVPAADPVEASRPEQEKPEESYFRIPEEIGIVASPGRKDESKDDDEAGDGTDGQPMTFGRKPRAGGRRRR